MAVRGDCGELMRLKIYILTHDICDVIAIQTMRKRELSMHMGSEPFNLISPLPRDYLCDSELVT